MGRFLNGSMVGYGDSNNSPRFGSGPGIWTPDDANRQLRLQGIGNLGDRSTLSYEWPVAGSDPSWSSTIFLCHMDEITSGSASQNLVNTASANSGACGDLNPVTGAGLGCGSTQFGGYALNIASGYGTFSAGLVGSNTALAFGTGDFTIEFWINPTSNANAAFFDMRNGEPSVGPALIMSASGQPSGSLSYRQSGALKITTSLNVISLNAWHHVAVSRSSGSTKLFLDGTQIGSTYADASNITSGGNNNIYFGNINVSIGTSAPQLGYFQEIRITKAGRYTSNFTAPTTRFLDY